MYKLKGYRKINKFLTNWCHENGFDVKCRLHTDFQYEDSTKIIYYALTVPQKHDQLFLEVCKPYLINITSCDNFILSFFHELGHNQINDFITAEDWEDYYKLTEQLKTNTLTEEDYLAYYLNPVELEATKWGCTFISMNIDLIQDFWLKLQPMILEFYTVNKINNI